jgi:Arc/MetJ-type ribon-helix-helix transcriptional regulator
MLGNIDIALRNAKLKAMKSASDDTSLPLPSSLIAQIEAQAGDEHRAASDVVKDAMTCYMRQKRWQKIRDYGAARARELGITEDDIPRLIAESRAERQQGRE